MAEQIAQLIRNGAASDKATRVAAEEALQRFKFQPNYAQFLLQISQSPDPTLAPLAAIHFKNLIKNHWATSDFSDFALNETDKAFIKSHLLSILLASQGKVQALLAESLTLISAHEFPQKWPELVPSLVASLQSQQLSNLHGVLSVGHSIFKGFKHKFKSDELFSQVCVVVFYVFFFLLQFSISRD
jgi:exportin-2 (importin alpha re-exporter)